MIIRLPIFETSRLILREIREEDYLNMYEYASLSFVGPNAGWEPHSSYDQTRLTIKMFNNRNRFNQLGVFAIILKSESKMIGTVELHSYIPNYKAELGYTVSPFYWGKGYAVEAAREIIKWGFEELNLKRIECSTYTTNKQSRKVCEKLNLTYEGISKKGYMLYDGTCHDVYRYGLTDEEYRCQKNN